MDRASVVALTTQAAMAALRWPRSLLTLVLVHLAACDNAAVLVVGATGQTGSRIYERLKASGVPTHAFIRNVTKARQVLGCVKCDSSEGIFIGDVTNPSTIGANIFEHTGTIVIATGPDVICNPYPTNCTCPKGACPVDVDWHGSKNVITAFAMASDGRGKVVQISSDCTTYPGCSNPMAGHRDPLTDPLDGHFKLDTEAFLMSSGLPFTIIKPCGLTNDAPVKAALDTFHDDLKTSGHGKVARADIARLVDAAIHHPEVAAGLRFDFCSKPGPPTPDSGLVAVLKSARRPWLKS